MVSRTRVGYEKNTLNDILVEIGKQPVNVGVGSIIKQIGLSPQHLVETLRHNSVEFTDFMIKLRHETPTLGELSSMTEDESRPLYGDLASIASGLERHSKPYVSGIRVVVDLFLRELYQRVNRSPLSNQANGVKGVLDYKGRIPNFDETKCGMQLDGEPVKIDSFRSSQLQVDSNPQATLDSMINRAFKIKDLLNILESATNEQMYHNIRNTNEFPESRTRGSVKSFEYLQEHLKQLQKEYAIFAEQIRGDKSASLEILKKSKPRWYTRTVQAYGELQHRFSYLLNPTGVILVASSFGGAFYGFANQRFGIPLYPVVEWTTTFEYSIVTGPVGFLCLELGPKSARWLRDRTVGSYRAI